MQAVPTPWRVRFDKPRHDAPKTNCQLPGDVCWLGRVALLLLLFACVGVWAQDPAVPAAATADDTKSGAQTRQANEQPGTAQSEKTKAAKPAESAPVGTLEGKVKSGSSVVPGATITATNGANGQKVVGWSRADGSYRLALPATGEYVVKAQMAGFAVASQHVSLSAANTHPQLDLQITLLSRAQNAAGGAYARGGGGRQPWIPVALGDGGEAGANNGAENGESVAPCGNAGAGDSAVDGDGVGCGDRLVVINRQHLRMSNDEMRARMQDGREQQGGPGGPGGPGGGPAAAVAPGEAVSVRSAEAADR